VSRDDGAEDGLRARAVAAWRRRWFPEAPLSDLAVARVLLVAIVLYLNGGGLRFSMIAHAPPIAWDPVAPLAFAGVEQPSVAIMHALRVATNAALLASLVGLATNLAMACAFLLQLFQEGLLNSFGKVTHSTLPLLYAMLFFALAPCGGSWSLDAAIARWCKRRGANGSRAGTSTPPRTSRFARWPFELLLVELSFYYFDAGLTKLVTSGPAWADGFTLQYSLLKHDTPVGRLVAPHLALCALLSAGALAFELLFPLTIVFRRLLPWFLATGICFHLGNFLLLDLIFWPVMAVYPLLVPWSMLRRRAAALAHRYGAPLRARLARGTRA
jgi:hypothetical protein